VAVPKLNLYTRGISVGDKRLVQLVKQKEGILVYTKRLFDTPAARKTGGDALERLIAQTLAIETESAQEAGAMGYMARAIRAVQCWLSH
jgi:hypothetical protein